jgi:predicted DNA-binding protein
MAQTRGARAHQAIKLPPELLERLNRHASRLKQPLQHSVHLDTALRRLPILALEDAENTTDSEAIPQANEPLISWEEVRSASGLDDDPDATGGCFDQSRQIGLLRRQG